jgi:hypothetical protein
MSGVAMVRRDNRLVGLVLAAALHVGVLALVLITPAKPLQLPVGSSVPINIVSSEPTDVRPAVQAPQTQAAAAPQPVPQAPPQPPAPTPAPTPSFTHVEPKPTPPQPRPQPAPVQPSPHPVARPPQPTPPQPAQARPAPPRPSFDIDRLQQIIQNAQRNAGNHASSAPRGPPRAETAPQPRPDAGHGLTQSDLVGLSQLLERLWTLQCDVGSAASTPTFKVRFVVDLSGNLLGTPNAGGLEHSSDPVTASVARRALDAVHAVFPLPQQYYGQTVTVNFNAKEACAKR